MKICPVCRAHLVLSPQVNRENAITVDVREQDDRYNFALHALHAYWRWCAEGKKRYGPVYKDFSVDPNVPYQYFYDSYHKSITYHPETDDYTCSIQLFDSPEGDTWWYGRFKYSGGKIEIIEKDNEYKHS